MKREIAAYILLAVLLAGALINIRAMDNIIGQLRSEVDAAYSSAKEGDFNKAKSQLEGAAEQWENLDGYTHIFIRHTEIDSTTDAFFDMLSDVSDENEGSLDGSYRKLDAHLESLMTMEHISIGSIF